MTRRAIEWSAKYPDIAASSSSACRRTASCAHIPATAEVYSIWQ
jgi:hypothetical protein